MILRFIVPEKQECAHPSKLKNEFRIAEEEVCGETICVKINDNSVIEAVLAQDGTLGWTLLGFDTMSEAGEICELKEISHEDIIKIQQRTMSQVENLIADAKSKIDNLDF